METKWIGLIATGAALVFFVASVILCCLLWRKCRPCSKPPQDDVENQAATSGESAVQDASNESGHDNLGFQPVPAHVCLVSPGVVAGQDVRQTILHETVSVLQRTSLAPDERVCSIQLQRLEENALEQRRLPEVSSHQQRLEQVRFEQQRLEEQRLGEQRLEQERLEQQRIEQERLQQQRLEEQRIEQQRLEQQRLEQQRIEQQRLEQQILEQQSLEQLRVEQNRFEAQQIQQNLRQIYVQPNTLFVGDDDDENDNEDEDDDENDNYDDRWQNRRRGRSRERNLNKTRHRSESGDYSRQREVTDPDKTIDLHYLSVQDAMYTFRQFLGNMENDYHNSNYRRVDRFIHVITGRGLHSRNRIPKIRPEVQKYLCSNYYDHEWKNNGGLVTIDLLSKRRSFM